jgi:AcrR family transcriptional regulator
MSQRSDARRNRARILTAAEEIFAAESVAVPLQQVAERAQVGRGTLYRHFPDRHSLVAAVYEERLAAFEALATEHRDDPGVLLTLVREITAEQARIPGLFRLIFSEGPGHAELAPLWARSLALLTGPLESSRAAGVVRADLTLDDLLMIIGMVYGVVTGPIGRADAAAVARAMDLVVDGLRPRP